MTGRRGVAAGKGKYRTIKLNRISFCPLSTQTSAGMNNFENLRESDWILQSMPKSIAKTKSQ
jgi:enoyl-[acyl-carrier-protein] reductase (NADH)